MFGPLDPTLVTHGIQLAVAPVFLLTAVSGTIGVIAGRLARIIDRARLVENMGLKSTNQQELDRLRIELAELRLRGRLSNACIALLTSCAFLIGLTIFVLFLGETTQLQYGRLAVFSFMAGVVSFLSALLCFLTETYIASRLLNFKLPLRVGD